jgi:hypothetical protein
MEIASALAAILLYMAKSDPLEFLDGEQVVILLGDVIYEIDEVKDFLRG